jgi:hypothetical protein
MGELVELRIVRTALRAPMRPSPQSARKRAGT